MLTEHDADAGVGMIWVLAIHEAPSPPRRTLPSSSSAWIGRMWVGKVHYRSNNTALC